MAYIKVQIRGIPIQYRSVLIDCIMFGFPTNKDEILVLIYCIYCIYKICKVEIKVNFYNYKFIFENLQ